MSTTTSTASAQAPTDAGFRIGPALAILLAGIFMTSTDIAIANVAAPSIQSGLGTSGTMVLLIVSAYSISYAMLLVASARLGDEHGHRRLFGYGMAVFTLASLVCGLAPDAPLLLVARIVQGAGGALLAPQVLSIIQLRLEGRQRALALALYGTVLSLGVVVGLVLGGALVSADLLGSGWRPVFLINVPIGALLLLLTPRIVPWTHGGTRRPVDLPGTLLVSATTLLLLLPAVLGQQQGWPAWTIVSLAAGGVLAVVTGVVLRGRAEGDGIVDVQIFSRPGVASGFLSIFTSTAAYGGFLFTLTVLLQSAIGFSALHTGLSVVPYAAGFAATSLTFEQLPVAARRYAPAAGLALLALGYFAMGGLTESGEWHAWATAIVLFVAGAGYGYGFSPVLTATLASVPLANARDASGSLGMTLQLGYLAGVALLGSVFLNRAHLPDLTHAGKAFFVVGAALAVITGLAALLAARTSRVAAATAE